MVNDNSQEQDRESMYTDKNLETLSNFINILIEKTIESNKREEHLYFRGESSEYDYRTPTLYRQLKLIRQGSEYYYRTLLNELGRDDYGENTSLVRLISELQHYGAVTRMLDVTSNPLVALYFALEGSTNDDGFLYIYSVNIDEEKFDTGHTIAIKSALNLMNQEIINNFLIACEKLIGNTNNYNDKTTDELNTICESADVKKRKEYKKYKKDIVKFMEILNQRARVRERLKYPFKIYEDLIKAHLVLPSKTTDRIRQQQGSFIFPRFVNVAKFSEDNNKEEIDKKIDESIQELALKNEEGKMETITIKGGDKARIKREIKMLGITEGFIYPDIEHVSRTLLKIYNHI